MHYSAKNLSMSFHTLYANYMQILQQFVRNMNDVTSIISLPPNPDF